MIPLTFKFIYTNMNIVWNPFKINFFCKNVNFVEASYFLEVFVITLPITTLLQYSHVFCHNVFTKYTKMFAYFKAIVTQWATQWLWEIKISIQMTKVVYLSRVFSHVLVFKLNQKTECLDTRFYLLFSIADHFIGREISVFVTVEQFRYKSNKILINYHNEQH